MNSRIDFTLKNSMSLNDLKPANSKKARVSSVNCFKRFLDDEGVLISVVDASVRADESGATLIALMDRFGVHLAHMKASDGSPLRRNTVGQYFRQTKLWIYERYPELSQRVDATILAKCRILERYSGMRQGGKTVKQAQACKKQDLMSLMNYLYSTATVAIDYQDAALLALLWYLFGRASDLTMVNKQSLSVCGDNVLFVRFLRVKTSEEQGLTIFPDDSPMTCPITAIAVALVLQKTPSAQLLPHLPLPTHADLAAHGPIVPLAAVLAGATMGRNLLDEVYGVSSLSVEDNDVPTLISAKALSSTPGIHAYVNRVLERISTCAMLTTQLSSHSFRRGGAQHVNGKAGVSPHWIADRGGWNMTTTNKVFTYIFNTTEEDQKVAKILSGHEPDVPLVVSDLSHFDALTRVQVNALQQDLFSNCCGLQNSELNVNKQVLDVLFAHLLKALPLHRSMQPTSPFVQRVDQAMHRVRLDLDQVLSWSIHLHNVAAKDVDIVAAPDSLGPIVIHAPQLHDVCTSNTPSRS
jgi:hypothetical protein